MTIPLTYGSLFAGIGGFDHALDRAGMRGLWQSELDPYCQRVLRRHWPATRLVPDVRNVNRATVTRVDVICGGFPCPAVSQAARGRNVAEWLWPEYARVIRDLRPRYVIVENVAGLLYRDRGFGEVLGDLAALGFDATWRVLRASDVGAPHHRPRLWLVGYTNRDGQSDLRLDDETPGLPQLRGVVREWSDPPACVGMDDGIPDRMERVQRLGNALVPHIAEWIGRRVIAHAAFTA